MFKKAINFISKSNVIARSGATWQSLRLKTHGIASLSARNDNVKKLSLRKLCFISALLGFSLVFSGFYIKEHQINLKAVMASYHLLPEPETLTELYFEDHLHLPSKLVFNTPYSFRFTIHNLEYKQMQYRYKVTAFEISNIQYPRLQLPPPDSALTQSMRAGSATADGGQAISNELPITNENKSELIKEDKVTLKHDEYATVPVEFTLKKKAERVKIEVNLVDQNQPIHFWLE